MRPRLQRHLPAPILRTLVILAVLAPPAFAQERTLYWPEIAVQARLDADGRLHVAERQTMVFTGDWNGGEREFFVGIGPKLDFQKLSRIDPGTGEAEPLVEGDLDQVDHYDWTDGSTLRWRSRLPTDPPFDRTPITYLLEYTISNAIYRDGDVYYLRHDFAFPDRVGVIERFVLDLDFDPVWQPRAGIPSHLEKKNLEPGQSVIVPAALERSPGAPRLLAVRAVTPAPLRALFFLGALAAMAWLYLDFRRHEAGLGRYESPDVPERPDPEWLREHLFDLRPEEVGALWDRKVGPPEVAATLARLVAEGKLASEVVRRGLLFKKEALRLRRIAPLHEFVGYERHLIEKLFFGGRAEVDTDEIRAHYRKTKTGLDPASLIEKELWQRLERQPDVRKTTPKPGWRRSLFLLLATLALVGLDAIPQWKQTLVLAAIVIFGVTWLYVGGILAAFSWRHRTERLDVASLGFLLPALGVFGLGVLASFYADWFFEPGRILPRMGLFGNLALALLPVTVLSSLLHNARTRESLEGIRHRKVLAAIRRWLRQELARSEPDLRDEWFPYLLAFGLQSEVDRWFRAFGGMTQSTGSFSGGGSSFGGSGGGGWTGGGGSFGGGGATSSWAAAATGLAAGVSAPSSSGGGGGGGGGSSGGGGGGGW